MVQAPSCSVPTSILLDWYLNNYILEPDKWAKGGSPQLYQVTAPDGVHWKLTTSERKRILLDHIYGVDIDSQAVEVTKLSLLLKVLEGESEETIGKQLTMFRERALPDLANNIKCGNSLIGSDFYTGKQSTFQRAEDQYRINSFDWQKEFSDVFTTSGGFDVIIGNPPYIRIQSLKEWSPLEVEFYKKQYVSASKGNYDIYVVFVERGLSLLNINGRLGFILPSKFFATDYGEQLRKIISDKQSLSKIVDFGHMQVFERATTYTCLLFLSGSPQTNLEYGKVNSEQELSENIVFRSVTNSMTSSPWIFGSELSSSLAQKITESSKPLGDLPSRIGRGSSSGADNIFIVKRGNESYFTRHEKKIEIEDEILRIPIYATSYGRYVFRPQVEEAIIFPYQVSSKDYSLIDESLMKQKYPKAYKYLLSRKKDLEKRKQFKAWYSFSASRNLEVHETAQILVPLLANNGLYCRLSSDSSSYCLMASGGFSITVSPECGLSPNYILGLLNSRLLFWRLQQISNIFRGGWITCTKQYVETLPIHIINFSDPNDLHRHDKIVSLVESMLLLNQQLANAQNPTEKTLLQRQIDTTDHQIDTLVYELYG